MKCIVDGSWESQKVSYQVITACLHGKGRTAAGYHWRFTENRDKLFNEIGRTIND